MKSCYTCIHAKVFANSKSFCQSAGTLVDSALSGCQGYEEVPSLREMLGEAPLKIAI